MFETPEFPRGSQLTAAKLQETADLLELILRSRGSNASIGSCGFLEATPLPETFWARVTGNDGGSPPAHSWVQVQENGATVYLDMGDGMKGDTAGQPLYDINGQLIPTNKYVRIWRGMGDYYLTLDGDGFNQAYISLTSETPSAVTLASGGSVTAYAAKVWTLVSGVWTAGAACWYLPVNEETPGLDLRFLCNQVSQDNSAVPVYSKELFVAAVQVTSLVTSSVPLSSGGSLTVYPAEVQVLVGGALTNTVSGWFFPLNGETPKLNFNYHCLLVAKDTGGAPVWATEIQPLLTVTDINPNSLTISNVSTIEVDRSGHLLHLVNDSGKAELQAYWQALDKTGAVVDAGVGTVKADPNGYLTWTELSAGNVQLVVNASTIISTNITIVNNFTWNLNNFYWTINGGGGIIFDVPFEICGYQFWCCTTWSLSASSYNNLALPAVGSPDQGATVYDISTSNTGGTTITGIVPANFNGAAGPQVIVLTNTGLNPITISGNNASSTATNRIFLPPTYGTSVTLEQDDTIMLWWDYCTDHCWKVISCTVDIDSSGGTTGTNGETVLPSAYNVTSSFADTGLSVTLPNAGTYLVQAEVTGTITNNGSPAGGYVQARLWNVTSGAAVNDTLRVVCECQVVGLTGTGSTVCGRIITVSGSTTIRLEAQYISTGSVLASPTIAKGTTSFGTTLMRYIKLA